jgi:hypothetical protein
MNIYAPDGDDWTRRPLNGFNQLVNPLFFDAAVDWSSNVAAKSLNDLATVERGAPSIIDFPLFTDWLQAG